MFNLNETLVKIPSIAIDLTKQGIDLLTEKGCKFETFDLVSFFYGVGIGILTCGIIFPITMVILFYKVIVFIIITNLIYLKYIKILINRKNEENFEIELHIEQLQHANRNQNVYDENN